MLLVAPDPGADAEATFPFGADTTPGAARLAGQIFDGPEVVAARAVAGSVTVRRTGKAIRGSFTSTLASISTSDSILVSGVFRSLVPTALPAAHCHDVRADSGGVEPGDSTS